MVLLSISILTSCSLALRRRMLRLSALSSSPLLDWGGGLEGAAPDGGLADPAGRGTTGRGMRAPAAVCWRRSRAEKSGADVGGTGDTDVDGSGLGLWRVHY